MLEKQAAILAEMAIIKARMRAIESGCATVGDALVATDDPYGQHEALQALLWDMEDANV